MIDAFSYGEWMSPSECMAEIERVRPDGHAGKELANSAMMGGFRMRARSAVFLASDGSGRVVERVSDYLINPDEAHPTFEDRDHRGLQKLNLAKAEGELILPAPAERQVIKLYGITYHRDDVARHFGLVLAAPEPSRPARGFDDTDRELLALMRQWIAATNQGISAAAAEYAGRAVGGGSLESKAKRLERKYVREFGR